MKKIPEFLIEMLKEQYGDINKIIDGYNQNRLTTLRVNTIKTNCLTIKETLDNLGIVYDTVDWYRDAFIIKNCDEKKIKSLPMYENGEIYLQSLSSMIPPLIVEPKKGENILDMAAAPGGKTTQMVALSNNESLITACEKNKIRAEKLKYNLNKQGANRVGLIINNALELDDFLQFDKILLDAPCSGSGTLSSSDDSFKTFTKELVDRSCNLQLRLLRKAIKLLKPKHELVYSTCSILSQENEEVIKKILADGNVELLKIDKAKFKNIPMLSSSVEGTITVCPTDLYEGFFVAKLRKK